MDTISKLTEARDLMKQAENLVTAAKEENPSLRDYYGYSLEIIIQELNKFGDNSCGYIASNSSLEDIIEDEGRNWNNDGSEVEKLDEE